MKITEKKFDVITGEETILEREETPQEIAEREVLDAEKAQLQADSEAKIAIRQAVLDRLGLNADEAALLLG